MADKTALDWTIDVINITMEIRSKFPELSKYIEEMPVNLIDNNLNKESNMKEYFESLDMLLKNYAKSHDVSL